jgi:hypothetical protein
LAMAPEYDEYFRTTENPPHKRELLAVLITFNEFLKLF